LGGEFPNEFVAACVAHYRRPTREHPVFAQHRRGGRSFPTDYTVRFLAVLPDSPAEVQDLNQALVEAHWNEVVSNLHELEDGGRVVPRRIKQAKRTMSADMRVFAGPSDEDVTALPHIDEAWCVAEFVCADLGLRTDVWAAAEQRMRGVHLRYGLMLDWTTRDIARRMARDSGVALDLPNSDPEDLTLAPPDWIVYGLDPIRVALEHGAAPDELDELYAAAGLRPRGYLSPYAPMGRTTGGWFGDDRHDPNADPVFREIVEIRDRVYADKAR
jgi:hypothetical protein